MPTRFRVPWTVLAATALALVFAAPAFGRSYDVTISDLTDGQPLTPPVVATHVSEHPIFEVGQPASVGVREIAENGNTRRFWSSSRPIRSIRSPASRRPGMGRWFRRESPARRCSTTG